MTDREIYIEKVRKIDSDARYIEKEESFSHYCKKCGGCCVNTKVELSVYDIWNIRKHLFKNMPLEDFLMNYCDARINKNGLPIIFAKNHTFKDKEVCTFLKTTIVSKNKVNIDCKIKKYKPGVCSLDPLGRVYLKDEGKVAYCFLPNNSCRKIGRQVKVEDYVKNTNEKFFLADVRFKEDLIEKLSDALLENMKRDVPDIEKKRIIFDLIMEIFDIDLNLSEEEALNYLVSKEAIDKIIGKKKESLSNIINFFK